MSRARIFLVLAVGLAALLAPLPVRAGEVFTTLKENSWVCVSPEAYEAAVARASELKGQDLEPLKKELGDQKQCMFVDADLVDRMMAPYAVVLERTGSKIRIQFIVTFRKRIEFLHRLTERVVLVGWTDEDRLEPKEIL